MKRTLSIILFILLIFPATAQQAQDLYKIKVSYDKGEVSIKDISNVFGYFQETKNQPNEGYSISILNKNEEILFKEKFNFPLILTDPLVQLESADKTIFAPCNENSEKLRILSKSNQVLLEKDLDKCHPNLEKTDFTPSWAIYLVAIIFLLLIIFTIFLIKKYRS